MICRVSARKNIGVRWERRDVVRVRVREPHAAGSQPIDPGCGRPGVSVGADRISSESVDCNKENVKVAPRLRSRESPPSPQARGESREDEEHGRKRCATTKWISFRMGHNCEKAG